MGNSIIPGDARAIVNTLGLAATILLLAVTIWIATLLLVTMLNAQSTITHLFDQGFLRAIGHLSSGPCLPQQHLILPPGFSSSLIGLQQFPYTFR